MLLVLLAMTPFVGLLVIIFVKVMGTGAGVFAFIELVKPKNNSGSRSGRPGRSGSVSVNRPAAGAETGITTVKPTESGSDVHAEHGVEGNTEQQVPEQIESQAASQDVNEREPSITDSVHAGGLWERFAAAFIDFLLVAIVTRIIFAPFAWFTSFLHQSHDGGPFTVTLFLVYLILMWGLKGTTIGNIIFHLKIQRIDGKPVTWSVALIRGLGLVLSVAPLGLGFFWMAWDENKQTWHDKIAGTEVIRVPRGVNLVDR